MGFPEDLSFPGIFFGCCGVTDKNLSEIFLDEA
jgi:hypothetical protein